MDSWNVGSGGGGSWGVGCGSWDWECEEWVTLLSDSNEDIELENLAQSKM